MERNEDLANARHDLSLASRNDHWLKTLPGDRRAAMGRTEYRRRCADARRRMKAADGRCRDLLRQAREGRAPLAA